MSNPILDETHEEELKRLFSEVSVPSKTPDIHYITFEGFKIAISTMMNKAFYFGQINSINEMQSSIDSIFQTHE